MLGLLLGGAARTTQLFGRQITQPYRGTLQTVLDRRNEGHPILRAYSQTSFVQQYEQAETLLRTDTCILACPDAGGDPRHLNGKRRLDHLPQVVEAAFHQVDLALDQLCTTRGLTLAA